MLEPEAQQPEVLQPELLWPEQVLELELARLIGVLLHGARGAFEQPVAASQNARHAVLADDVAALEQHGRVVPRRLLPAS